MTKNISIIDWVIYNETHSTKASEKLIAVLQSAIISLQNATATDIVVASIKSDIDDAMNPNIVLEKELDELVKNETPPWEEYYNSRKHKKWGVLAFFDEKYGEYYKAGILYKFQLRKMDPLFCDLLDKTKWAPKLPTKKKYLDKQLSMVSISERKRNNALHSALHRRTSSNK